MSDRPVPIEDLLAQRDWVRRLARGLVGGAADREDVEQETWLRALRRPPRAGGSIAAWFARVVRSVGIDVHRADRQRRLREHLVARAEAQDVADTVAEAEAFRRVVEAAYALEEPQRTVVLLRYFEDLSIPAIARKLSLDEEAVRSRLRRALVRMRERLDERSGGDRSAWVGAVAAVAGKRSPPPLAPSVAAGVAGGVVMAGGKIAAAVAVVVAAIVWWALRDDGAPPDAPSAVAPGEPTQESGRLPGRRPRAKPVAEDRAGAPAVSPAPEDAGKVGVGAAPARVAADTRPIRLRVLDQHGAPVANAAVRIFRAPGGGLLGLGAEAHASTGEDGSFATQVPPGDFVARLSAEGYVDVQVPIVEGEEELRVRLDPAWTLRGTVVAKETGAGVDGIVVTVRRAGAEEVVGATVTGADGTFTVLKLPEEAIDLLVAEPTGAVDPHLEQVMTVPERLRFAPARVGAVPPRSGDVRIELFPGLAIAGVLVDDAGAAVASAVDLELIGRSAQGGPDYRARRWMTIRDPRGAFRVDGLAAGEYDLLFVPSGPPEGTPASPLGAARVTAVAAGTADLRVVLSAGATIRLRVLGADGQPAGIGAVYVYASGGMAGSHGTVIAMPREEGRFETAPLDRSKSFDVLLSAFAGHLQSKRTGLRPGGDEVVVTLERAGRVSGRVVDEEGRAAGAGVPVSAAAQGVVGAGPGTLWTAYTDAAGAFVMDALGDHAFALAAGGADSGFVPAGAVKNVRPGRADLVVRVRRGATLTGRLVDASGKPVRTHLLAANPPEADGAVAATTKIEGDDGRFVFRGVRPGPVRVRCFVGDRYLDAGETVAPATDVELVLREP